MSLPTVKPRIFAAQTCVPALITRSMVGERGTAAIEFALVLPTMVVLLCGIAAFGSALYSKQLLYDMAGETARTCVMRNLGDAGAVQDCVQTVGRYLAASGNVHEQPCLGQAVVFSSNVASPSTLSTPTYAPVRVELRSLEVQATCNFSFAPGFVGVLSETLRAPTQIAGFAAMPWLYDRSPR